MARVLLPVLSRAQEPPLCVCLSHDAACDAKSAASYYVGWWKGVSMLIHFRSKIFGKDMYRYFSLNFFSFLGVCMHVCIMYVYMCMHVGYMCV